MKRPRQVVVVLWCVCFCVVGFCLSKCQDAASPSPSPAQSLMVPLTLINGADSKEAVCLDGTLPGYHFDPGSGSGTNSWLIQLEGGGWCYDLETCIFRKSTSHGSSTHMEKLLNFNGILSNKPEENPVECSLLGLIIHADFFNWNRVELRYCDGASFAGDGYDKAAQLHFRGQRIWLVAMEALMAKGMRNAQQALLSGCSAGGLASILHCDVFRDLFPQSTKVKCLSDAGMFLDVIDVSGGRTLRDIYRGVVTLQGVQTNLPSSCTSSLDPTSCFFPQNLVPDVRTPLFLLNSAYDLWQIRNSLAPQSADPLGYWEQCEENHMQCNSSQMQFLQDFRNQMLDTIKVVSSSNHNGLFINSCFAHCQSAMQETWFATDSPRIGTKRIAEAVGDWYFDREEVKDIDGPYPCDTTCHNLDFNGNTTGTCGIAPASRSPKTSISLVNMLLFFFLKSLMFSEYAIRP